MGLCAQEPVSCVPSLTPKIQRQESGERVALPPSPGVKRRRGPEILPIWDQVGASSLVSVQIRPKLGVWLHYDLATPILQPPLDAGQRPSQRAPT